MLFKFKKYISVVLLVISSVSYAEIPEDYYNTAVGKSGAELKTALFNIIHPHTMLEYYSSSTSFRTTDWHPATSEMPNGYFWDMYSNFKRTSWSDMNREHCLPKSWFGISSDEVNSAPIATDLHNLYPSDATANSRKNNYPLGIVLDDPESNGVIKVGSNTYPGYTGTVFEPADEYKGDFARDYMYMVTCYEDYANTWQSLGTSSMLIKGSTYPVFKQYSINLLMEWSRNVR
ncbi:MAG: endonuclease [Paludibacter sp.]|nr:endonuclease [Paludibacter sp.]